MFSAYFLGGEKHENISKKLMWQEASTLIVKHVDFPFGLLPLISSDLVKESNAKPEEGEDDRHARQGRGLLLSLPSQGSFSNDMNSLPLCASWIIEELRRNARLKTPEYYTCRCVQAESDEAARYMPGSAIYLGKQNRVLCRAALVAKKHPSDEDGLWTRIRPFFFCNWWEPHILDSTLPFFWGAIQVMHSKFQPAFWARRGCTCSQATTLWSLYGQMSTRRGSDEHSLRAKMGHNVIK